MTMAAMAMTPQDDRPLPGRWGAQRRLRQAGLWAGVGLATLGLCACATVGPSRPASAHWSPPAVARTGKGRPATSPSAIGPSAIGPSAGGPRYKVGAPYQAGGVWYVPAEQPDYDEVGIASWYGDAFHGKPTANGEIFDMNAPSAAHATLPMPCLVEVTNLDNGRVITVRMNDRGPFHPGRIIDLSHAAATRLGFAGKGTARVRVRYAGPAPLVRATPPMTFASRSPMGLPQAPSMGAAGAEAPPAPEIGARIGEGGWVQVGAYGTRDAADRAAARVGAGQAVDVRPLARGGTTLYRVVVRGGGQSAEAARTRLSALGFTDARAVAGF